MQWRSLNIMALLMFVAEYGPLFWAEKYVPSGVVSVLAATLPILTLILEMLILRQQRMRPMLAVATILGFVGVAVLLDPRRQTASRRHPLPRHPRRSHNLGTRLRAHAFHEPARSPPSPPDAAMMLGGAMLLALSAGFGEITRSRAFFLRAVGALLYLIVFGSLLAFTAFVWLLAHMPATRVSSHAYVNPIVAVALGYFMAGEVITGRILIGTSPGPHQRLPDPAPRLSKSWVPVEGQRVVYVSEVSQSRHPPGRQAPQSMT